MKKFGSLSIITFFSTIYLTCYLSIVSADTPVTANQDVLDESITQLPASRDPGAVHSLVPGVQEGNVGDPGNNAFNIDGVNNLLPRSANTTILQPEGQSIMISGLKYSGSGPSVDLNKVKCKDLTDGYIKARLSQLRAALINFDKSQSKDPELQKKIDCIKKKITEYYKKLKKAGNQKNIIQREKGKGKSGRKEPVMPGVDIWTTPPGTWSEDFSTNPIPEDFFGVEGETGLPSNTGIDDQTLNTMRRLTQDDMTSLAYTNPIFVDRDGSGYTPPGLTDNVTVSGGSDNPDNLHFRSRPSGTLIFEPEANSVLPLLNLNKELD